MFPTLKYSMNDPDVYTKGAKRMVVEGNESADKIVAFMKSNKDKLDKMTAPERKKIVLDFEPSKMFNQVHPIVFQYLVEGVFSREAFRRYVMAVYGKPKDPEDQARMQKDRRFVYHFKNAQMALYYKYLLIDSNPRTSTNKIHEMYEEMVKTLNDDTDKMLDAYEKAEADAKEVEAKFARDKVDDLIELLKKRNKEV